MHYAIKSSDARNSNCGTKSDPSSVLPAMHSAPNKVRKTTAALTYCQMFYFNTFFIAQLNFE